MVVRRFPNINVSAASGARSMEIVWARVTGLLREHKGEALWALAFAVLLPIALALPSRIRHSPEKYKVYIVYGFLSGVPVLRELPPKHSLLDRLGEFLV